MKALKVATIGKKKREKAILGGIDYDSRETDWQNYKVE